MNIKLFFFTLFITTFCFTIIGQINNSVDVPELKINDFNKIYSLDRDWYFTNNDNSSSILNDIDLNTWQQGSIAGAWIESIPDMQDFQGTGLYKLPVNITQLPDQKIGMTIPFSYGPIEFYINDQLIYKSKKKFGNKPIFVEIPREAFKIGKNFFTFRVTSYSGWGGLSEFIEIGSYEKIHNNWMFFLIKNISMSFISLFLTLYMLIIFLFRTKDRYNLLFALFGLSIAMFIMGYYGLWYYLFNYSWAYWLLTFLGGIGMYLFPILFIHSFFNLKLRIIGKIFTWFYSFLALFVFVEYLFTGQIFFFNKYLYMFFTLSYVLIIFYLLFFTIKVVLQKYKYSKTMLIANLILTSTFIYSMLCFSQVINRSPLIGEGFFLMTLMFAIVLAKRAAQTHSDLEFAHADLEFTNAENVALNDTLEEKVEERTLELREKNAEITQSIEYSALIQNSMLPSDEQFSKVFSDHYAVWKPKDTVGGDFYWFKQLEEGFILAIIDCTGHGVPGALLTMTATAALERIVTHINCTDPGLMLKEMNKIVKRLLSQDNPYDIKDDGLDIGLCYYNSNDKKMTFAGSKIRLFIDDDGELLEIRGDRQGIGYKRSKAYYSYTNHVINVTDKKTFHMTTDGFLDQSGGDKGFGYGWTKYRKLLIKNRDLPLKDQIERIEEELLDYQGDESQRDDITLLGFKIKLD